jgi:Mg-chelatase subunit ChlD
MTNDLDIQRPWLFLLLLTIPALLLVRRYAPLRKRPRPLRPLLGWFRALEIVLLVTVLTGPMITSRTSAATAIFVLDGSRSVQEQSHAAATRWITDTIGSSGLNANAAVIGFGAEPDLLVPPSATDLIDPGWASGAIDPVTGDATDIGSALDLAMALPVGEQRRIVLLSDGSENAGSINATVERARQAGIPIDVVALNGIDANDLRIAQVAGPSAVWQGDPVSLLVTVGSGAADSAQIQVTVDGAVVANETVAVPAGTTSLSVTTPALTPGFHAIEVSISGNADLDRVVENNSAPFGVVVRDRAQVLVIAPVGSDPARFTSALTEQGAEVTTIAPSDVPTTLAGLNQWDAVVLDNVPSWDLSTQQQELLVEHTRNGHGLIVIGGSASYGPGSYAGTPLEDALPVSVKVTDGRQRPKVAVLIVVDKSGSMSFDPNAHGESKLELAKDGVVTAASALTSGDQIGVIAFNDEPVWALPMTTLDGNNTINQINNAIAPLQPDGGTELYPALQLAYDSLRNTDADVRHIILLSDGKSRSGSEAAYIKLIDDAANDNVSLSAVALGTDADVELLEAISTQGGGRYHFATTPDEIPQITFEEAKSAGSQSVLRGSFQPVQQQPSTILNGIDVSTLPPIDGYNFAQARTDAQVDLTSDRRDPLLSKWQLGLGRVIAWTADDGSDFASSWSTWPDYALFWGNALRWSLPDPDDGTVRTTSATEGLDTIVSFDANLPDGSVMPLEGVSAAVTLPDDSVIERPLVPTGSGTWQVRLAQPAPGAYKVELTGGTFAETSTAGTVSAVVVPPSREFQPSESGTSVLAQIAAATGGTELSLDNLTGSTLFTSNGNADSAPGTIREIWQWPLAAFLLAFLLELAVRLGWLDMIRGRLGR